MATGKVYALIDGSATTVTGTAVDSATFTAGEWGEPKNSYQAILTGTGAVTATVVVQVSNDGTNFLDLGTISLSGTNSAGDGFVSDAPWRYFRGKVTGITGTGAAVTLLMGV